MVIEPAIFGRKHRGLKCVREIFGVDILGFGGAANQHVFAEAINDLNAHRTGPIRQGVNRGQVPARLRDNAQHPHAYHIARQRRRAEQISRPAFYAGAVRHGCFHGFEHGGTQG